MPRCRNVEEQIFIRREIAQRRDECPVHLPQNVAAGPVALGRFALRQLVQHGRLELLDGGGKRQEPVVGDDSTARSRRRAKAPKSSTPAIRPSVQGEC